MFNRHNQQSPLIRSIRWVLLFIALLCFIFIPAILLFSYYSFRTIETREVKSRVRHAKIVLQNEIEEVSRLANRFSTWQKTSEFIITKDPKFISENLNENLQKNMDINLVYILDSEGNILYSKVINLKGTKIKSIDFDINELFQNYPNLFENNPNKEKEIEGLVYSNKQVLLISINPIINDQTPANQIGTIVFGRFLDLYEHQKLSEFTNFPVYTQSLDSKLTSTEMETAKYVLTGMGTPPKKQLFDEFCFFCPSYQQGNPSFALSNPVIVLPFDKQLLGGYTILKDLNGTPIAILGIHITRDIEQLAKSNTNVFLLAFLGILVVIGIIGVKIVESNIKIREALDREYCLLRAVIDNVPEQLFAHDLDGNFILNNLRDSKMMGVDNPEELLGKNDFDFYPAELALEFQSSEKQIIETGNPINDKEDQIRRSDGELHWITTTKTPLIDNSGKTIGIVGVSRDITERKHRERELEAIVMMSRSLRTAETSNELLLMIYNQVIEKLQIDFGTLELIDKISGDAVVLFSNGFMSSSNGTQILQTQGLNKLIHATKKPYLNNNVIEHSSIFKDVLESGCTSIAGAPMLAEDELVGFLWIGRKTKISTHEVNLLAAMADIAASSIRRMSLHELTEKRLNQLISLRKIDTSINNSKELNITLHVLMEQVCKQLNADAVDVLLTDNKENILINKIGLGFTTNLFIGKSLEKYEGPAGIVVKNKEYLHINNIADFGPAHRLTLSAKKEGFISYSAVPLIVGSEIKGVMEVFFRKEHTPDQDWIDFFETLAGQAAIAIEQVQLFEGMKQSNNDLIRAYDETIQGWVRALDLRDEETEGHSIRVSNLCVQLAREMGIEGDELIHIRRGSLLHDIGKVGVPDRILLKPDKLTDEEWIIMKGHPSLAFEMLSPIEYLIPAIDIPYYHHEKWDGTGYPCQLKGEEIPLAARIFSIIDVWDALSSDRPYRKAWNKQAIVEYIRSQSGIHFDPWIVKNFLNTMV